jgi:phosphoribosylcarboxyaminoimidazole (NCAIR) mutase
MYFTSENCDKTKLLPVIAVPITNDVSSKDLTVTEVIKVPLPNPVKKMAR